MKKTLVYVLIIIALAAIAWYVVKQNNYQSSITAIEADYAFGIPDTATITKIVITDKSPGKVELTRGAGMWMVNGEFEARPDAIEVLLETFNRMSMRSFVPVPSQKTIINRMAVYGQEVHVYAGEKLIKHFYVGTETPDQTGTYMMIAGASQPYSVHIQGFVGYLNSRFFTDETLWRRRILFGVDKENIASIKMNYWGDDVASFSVDNAGENPKVLDTKGNIQTNTLAVNLNIYLGSFRTANYEGAILKSDGIWAKKDSIQNSTPVFELTITDKNGKVKSLTAHRKHPDSDELVGDDGLPMEWDPNRMYAFLEDGRMVLIQYFGLKNIIVERGFFSEEIITDN